MRNLKNDCVVEAVEPRVMFAVGPVDVAVGEGTPLRTITFTDTGGTTGVISVRGGSAVARFDGLDVTQTVSGRNVTVSGGATGLAWSTLTLSGRAPSATVRGTGGNEELVLRDGLLAAGPVRGFTGPAVVLRGTSTLGNGIAKLQVLRTEEGATLAINRGTNPVRGGASISIGSAVDTAVTVMSFGRSR